MPHLAPLTWALAPLLFWALLLTMSASLWWSFIPSFPSCQLSSSLTSFRSWNWK